MAAYEVFMASSADVSCRGVSPLLICQHLLWLRASSSVGRTLWPMKIFPSSGWTDQLWFWSAWPGLAWPVGPASVQFPDLLSSLNVNFFQFVSSLTAGVLLTSSLSSKPRPSRRAKLSFSCRNVAGVLHPGWRWWEQTCVFFVTLSSCSTSPDESLCPHPECPH